MEFDFGYWHLALHEIKISPTFRGSGADGVSQCMAQSNAFITKGFGRRPAIFERPTPLPNRLVIAKPPGPTGPGIYDQKSSSARGHATPTQARQFFGRDGDSIRRAGTRLRVNVAGWSTTSGTLLCGVYYANSMTRHSARGHEAGPKARGREMPTP